jgi:hypothetical protein
MTRLVSLNLLPIAYKRAGRLVRVAVSLCALWLAAGCEDSHRIAPLPPEMILESYSRGHVLISTRTVGENDPVLARLRRILAAHGSGWTADNVSYAPGPFIFRSPRLIVRCFPDMLVIDQIDGGRPASIQKKIPGVLDEIGLFQGNRQNDNGAR